MVALVFSAQSLATASLPHCPSLLAMRLVETCYGLGVGSFHTVGNQLLVRNLILGIIWATLALPCLLCNILSCPGFPGASMRCVQDLDGLWP